MPPLPLRTEEELLRVVEELRLTAELLREVEELLRTPVEELPRAAELLLTDVPVLLAVRLRTADEDTGATLVPVVRRPSILALDARGAVVDAIALPLRRTAELLILLLYARRFTLLPMAVA